ncbi:MAG: HNH endonuclease [Gemmataceae bacterium]
MRRRTYRTIEQIANRPMQVDFEPTPAVLARFFKKVDFHSETRCWVWSGHKDDKGYGQIKINGKAMWVHRFSYAVFRRPLIEGLTVEHKCRNTSCVNPWHLELLPNAENAARQHRDEPEPVPF